MICLEVSDQFSDITIIVEFFRWTIQIETSLHFLLKLLFNFYGQRGLYASKVWAPNLTSRNNCTLVVDILKGKVHPKENWSEMNRLKKTRPMPLTVSKYLV